MNPSLVVIWRTWAFRLHPQTANFWNQRCLHEDKSALNLQEPVFWTTGADRRNVSHRRKAKAVELKHGSHNEVVSLPSTTNKSSTRFQAEDGAARGVDHDQDFHHVGQPPAPAAATSCDVPGVGEEPGAGYQVDLWR